VLLKVQIFYDITPIRLVAGFSEKVITLETSLNMDKFTLRNFPEILTSIFIFFIIYILVTFLFFVLHLCSFYGLIFSNYIKKIINYISIDFAVVVILTFIYTHKLNLKINSVI